MSVRADFFRVGWIRRLSRGAFCLGRTGVKACEFPVELFDLGHEVWVKPGNLYPCLPQSQLPSTPNCVVRVQNPDDHFRDPSLDDPFSARELRLIASRARLKRREQGRTGQRVVSELLLEQRELRVLSGSELAAESLSDQDAVTGDDRSDLW